MAKNDWLVAGLNNPDFTTSDFSNIADMTTDNTQLLSRDEYLKSDYIKNNPAFQDTIGNFSNEKFNEYYKKRVQDFGDFQEEEITKGPALDMFDIDRTETSKIQDIKFDIRRGNNPDRQAIGIEGVNVWSDPEYSKRELAKQNKVYNTETGRFEDYTVNDHTLVSNPIEWIKDQFRDPLVLATYDEDGTHVNPITGIVEQHHKGDAKLNNKGTYYYETLGGRSVLGKDVLSVFDTFTVDGQGINKYDFFDSNDIEKSVAGTVMKNVAAVVPLFCGPVVGGIYAAAMIGREFSKSLPMLYGMATAFTDAETPSWLNTLAAYGTRMSGSTSDYAQQNTFAFENFGNLVSDVALQWGQQKAIAQVMGKLKGAPNYIEDAQKNAKALYDAKRATMGDSQELWTVCLNKYLPAAQKQAEQAGKLGRDMSLAYMAIVSNTDVYADALDHGASKKEAAAIALGSTLGMYAFDKYSHVGEIFFDDATGDATKTARRALRNEFRQAREAFSNIRNTDAPERNKLMRIITKSAEASKRVLSKFNEDLKYHTLGMTGKMVGEGLEEVGEELIADTSKSLYELAGALGFNTSTKDVGAWDNAFERYAMSFLGGAVGGGVFYGKEVWDKGSFHKPKLDEDIATLIRNGHVDELREQLAVMNKEGHTGNKKLSATDYEVTDDNKVVWRTTDDESTSQSQAVMSLVNDRINTIEEIIIGNRANLSDDALFDNMVLSEKRYNRYKNIAQITDYYQDFATILNRVVNDEMAYRHASETMEGTPDGTRIPNDTALAHLTQQQQQQRQANIDNLQQKLTGSKTALQDFLAGETSLDYTRKLNFAMDPALHQPFLEVDRDSYLQTLYPGKSLDQLTPEENIKFLTQQWPEYVQTQLKTKLSDAWEKYKQFEGTINPHLAELSQNTPAYKAWAQNIENLFTSGTLNVDNLYQSYKKLDDKLDTETDDDFNNRNTRIVNPITGVLETDAEFNLRKFNRAKAIKDYNEQLDKQWADNLDAELQKVNYQVDPITARLLRKVLPESGRLRSIINRSIDFGTVNPLLKSILKGLNTDLSNVGELSDAVYNTLRVELLPKENNTSKLLEALTSTTLTEKQTGDSTTLSDYLANDYEASQLSLQDALDDLISQETNPDSGTFFKDLEETSKKDLKSALETVINTNIQGLADASLEEITDGLGITHVSAEFDRVAKSQFAPLQNSINSIISDIQNNALFQLQGKLQSSIVNPVGELLKKIASSNGDTLPEIDSILSTIQDNYDSISDIHQLLLNDAQRSDLLKAKHYMDLLKVYMTAASTLPKTNTPVGHNRTINAFAASHADKLRGTWNVLPEIESDYATLYMQTLDQYATEIDNWISLSDKNSINKISKFTRTDAALSKTLWNVLSGMPRDFKFNGKTLDILEGIDTIDTAQLNSDLAQIPLYNLERLIYRNVSKFAADNGVTISELVKNSNLLESLIPGIKQLDNQRSSKVTDTLNKDSFTDFDKLQYLAVVLSEDPAKFYSALNQRVSANNNIAPIAVQEFSARIAQSSMNQTFRDIFIHARSLMTNQETPLLTNTTVVFGVAGAGKTQVILGSIDSAIKNEEVVISGPTADQAAAMKKAMNRTTSVSFDDMFIDILGADLWKKIKEEFNDKCNGYPFDGTYFSLTEGTDGLAKVRLKMDTIKFVQKPKAPKAIYVDEATHLSTLQAQILDAYAASIGAQVFLCGDSAQLGHQDSRNAMSNIDEGAVFSVRTPKLTISLRDNNLQKFQNQEAVRTLLDEVLDRRLYDEEDKYNAYFPTAESLYSKFNFRIYDDTELNGDMITGALTDGTIAKLKAGVNSGKSIAFIGNPSSAHLAKLQAAGINIDPSHILNLATMQGQEFDYVVVDETWTRPNNMSSAKELLQKLYTLMTRAREGSVFIDNGLSSIIGKNTISKNKSKAPSIKQGVPKLIADKLEILKQLDYTPINPTTQPAQGTQSDQDQNQQGQGQDQNQGQQGSGTPNTELDFNDPDTRALDTEAINSVVDLANEDKGREDICQDPSDGGVSIDLNAATNLGAFPIECYGDMTYLSVNVTNDAERTDKNGKKHKDPLWTIPAPTQGTELRNLQALLTDAEETAGGTEAFWYRDKLALQKRLYEVKSALMFQHSWPTRVNPKSLPATIVNNFNKTDWESGTYELEFREPTSQDVTPVHGNLKEVGFDFNGKRLIANIIFKVKDKKGRTCKFDLAGINSPKMLIDSKGKIKDRLRELISSDLDDATLSKLQGMLTNIDTVADKYKDWFKFQVDEFEKRKKKGEGSYSIDVSTAISTTQTTWFKKRSGAPIRLGSHLNPNNITENDVHSLIDQNPDKIFSPVYTFTSQESDFYNLDPSLRGKAVIFVTDDILMNPQDLISTYLAQKRNPKDNVPKVRMLLLNNYGLSFSQMNDSEFISAFQQGDTDRKPFRQNFTGIRMFTSLWNARASLIQFTKAYDEWLSANNLNEAQVKVLMQAQDLAYQNNSDPQIATLLQGAGLTVDRLSLLDDFNNKTCKDIPMFRLGFNRNGNGFHIQRYNVKDSIAYDKDEANLCAITPEKAKQFLKMIGAVMQPICPTVSSNAPVVGNYAAQNSLNVRLQKVDNSGKPTGEYWSEDEFIDLEQANHRRSLSGLLHNEQGTNTLKIETTDADGTVHTLAYPEGQYWSMIPNLLSVMTRTIAHYQYETGASANASGLFAKMSFPETVGHDPNQDTERKLEIDISSFFGQDGALAPTVDGKIDTSLYDMFDLIFHGTTEDIHRPVGDGKTEYTNPDGTKEVRQPLMQLDDAYFKNGFFINPDISRKTSGADATDIVGHTGHNNKLIFFEIATNPALFTVDVDMRSAGFRLNLEELINTKTEVQPQNQSQGQNQGPGTSASSAQGSAGSTGSGPAGPNAGPGSSAPAGKTQALGYLMSMEVINEVDNKPFDENTPLDEIKEAYDPVLQRGFETSFGTIPLERLIELPYSLQLTGEFETYKNWLSRMYGSVSLKNVGDEVIATTADGATYKVNPDGTLTKITSASAPAGSVSRLEKKFQNTTVGDALLAILNNPVFRETAIGYGTTEDQIDALMQDIDQAIQFGKTLTEFEDPLKERLNALMNNESYNGAIEALSESNEDLYSIVFEDC